MSFEATRKVWEASRSTGSKKLVLLCLAHHQNELSGDSWPSIDRIAAMCGIKRRQVFSILSELEAAGEVKRLSGARAGQANRYVVTPGCPAGVQPSAPRGAAGRTPTRAAQCTPPVQRTAPKSSMNGNAEPSTNEGRDGAASGEDVLVAAGCERPKVRGLIHRLRSLGKWTISTDEARNFVRQVASRPDWSVADAIEEIAVPGGCSRMLHTFRPEFLPPRSRPVAKAQLASVLDHAMVTMPEAA